MSKLVTLRIPSSILSEFPELAAELPSSSSKKTTTNGKQSQRFKVKKEHQPADSSPLAHPTPQPPILTNEILSSPSRQDSPSLDSTPQPITAVTKKRGGNKRSTITSSPGPTTDTPSRTDTPVGGGSGGGSTFGLGKSLGSTIRVGALTMNSNSDVELDRSGRPCVKWARSSRTIRSFSGFQVGFDFWKKKGVVAVTDGEVVISEAVAAGASKAINGYSGENGANIKLEEGPSKLLVNDSGLESNAAPTPMS